MVAFLYYKGNLAIRSLHQYFLKRTTKPPYIPLKISWEEMGIVAEKFVRSDLLAPNQNMYQLSKGPGNTKKRKICLLWVLLLPNEPVTIFLSSSFFTNEFISKATKLAAFPCAGKPQL